MVRELTAVFAAIWVILLLIQLPMMSAGPQDLVTYNAWVQFVHTPWYVLFSMIALIMVGYHAWTWFNLMGTVMWMRFGKQPVPSRLIILSMFVAWLVVSLIVAFFIATPIVGS
jgi:fumarate reductase subunit C